MKCNHCGKRSIRIAYFHGEKVCPKCFKILRWKDKQESNINHDKKSKTTHL